jgi:peptide/nickel transport system substrate-binding protein
VTRHIGWQTLLIVLGAILVSLLLTYLAVNYTTVLQPGFGGTYVEGLAGQPRYLNPLLSGYNDVDRDLGALLFSGLTRLNERGEVVPDLARQWDVIPTAAGIRYVFHLRTDAYWHDEIPVTADDVIYTISLLQDSDFWGPPELGASVWRIAQVEEVDQHTLAVTVPEPYAPFLDFTTFGILPAHLLRATTVAGLADTEFNLRPIGTGPFQLERIDVEEDGISSVVLKKSPGYYGSEPHLDRIQFRFYPNEQAVLEAYEDDEVEGIGRIPRQILPAARTYPDLTLLTTHRAEYCLILFNMRAPETLPFFHEREVRQALLHAIDREGMITDILDGQALVAHSPMIPGTWAYKQDISRYEFDPDKAAEMLDQSGWIRQGVGEHLRRKEGSWFEFSLLTSSDPDQLTVAESVAEQWRSLGITVTVEAAAPLDVRQALHERRFQAILIEVSLPGDPDPYPFWHETQVDQGQNYSGYINREMSELLEQARVKVGPDRGGRLELYDRFQELWAQEVPAIPLYIPVYTYGVNERLHNVQIGPIVHPADRFRTVADWWIVPRRVIVADSETE